MRLSNQTTNLQAFDWNGASFQLAAYQTLEFPLGEAVTIGATTYQDTWTTNMVLVCNDVGWVSHAHPSSGSHFLTGTGFGLSASVVLVGLWVVKRGLNAGGWGGE
jgi:hypothetical protein